MLILAMVAVYVGDIFALYGGRAFGRHRLAPVISPKKTWEGAIAGLVGSVAGSLLAPLWFARALPVRHAVALGLLLGTVGIAGDLAESLLKRAAEVKDSGSLLPGHGGILDRIDSLLFAAPVLYSYYVLFLAG
jgi:phosphatidate cytidylyltransferase